MTFTSQEGDIAPSAEIIDPGDADGLRRAFGHYPSGVAAVAATIDNEDYVIVASTFSVGLSLEPPLVQFVMQKSSQTWPKLHNADLIGISILSATQSSLCQQLAGPDRDSRLTNVNVVRRDSGSILLTESCVAMECSLFAEYPAGDHTIVVLQVESLILDQTKEPLVFHGSRFRALADHM